MSGKQKIELETYIQMNYFDRILRKANLRLMTMSSGQYELKRREDSDNKKEKAGLELNVIDHYNGSERSVKTLSGGETFQAVSYTHLRTAAASLLPPAMPAATGMNFLRRI